MEIANNIQCKICNMQYEHTAILSCGRTWNENFAALNVGTVVWSEEAKEKAEATCIPGQGTEEARRILNLIPFLSCLCIALMLLE